MDPGEGQGAQGEGALTSESYLLGQFFRLLTCLPEVT